MLCMYECMYEYVLFTFWLNVPKSKNPENLAFTHLAHIPGDPKALLSKLILLPTLADFFTILHLNFISHNCGWYSAANNTLLCNITCSNTSINVTAIVEYWVQFYRTWFVEKCFGEISKKLCASNYHHIGNIEALLTIWWRSLSKSNWVWLDS